MDIKLLEALMGLLKWDDRDRVCRGREEAGIMGCVGCPYDLGDQCDEASTEFVLRTTAKAAREYFEGINLTVGKPTKK